MDCLSVFNPLRYLISPFIIIYFFHSCSLFLFCFSLSFFFFFVFFCFSLFFVFLFCFVFFFFVFVFCFCFVLFCFCFVFVFFLFLFRYGYKRGFGCFNLLLCPSAPTFLGILEISGFRMSLTLKHVWSLWVALRRLTFSRSWNGGISQAWSIVAIRIIV